MRRIQNLNPKPSPIISLSLFLTTQTHGDFRIRTENKPAAFRKYMTDSPVNSKETEAYRILVSSPKLE